MELLIICIPMIIFPAFFYVMYWAYHHQPDDQLWEALNHRIPLTIDKPIFFMPARASTVYRGREIALTRFQKKLKVEITLHIAAASRFELSIRQKTMVGITIITTGDARFDNMFVVKGHPTTTVQTILDSASLRRELLKLCQNGKVQVTVKHGSLHYEQAFVAIAFKGGADYMVELLNVLCDFADHGEAHINVT